MDPNTQPTPPTPPAADTAAAGASTAAPPASGRDGGSFGTPTSLQAGQGLVEFFRTQRQNAAYVLLALSAVFLVATIWLAVKGFKPAGAKAADTKAEEKDKPFDPLNPDADTKVEPVDPRRHDYTVGWLGTLIGFLVTAGAGVWFMVGVPNPDVERQRTEARVAILTVGGVLGVATIVVGMLLFYRWSDSLTAWLDKGETKQAWRVLVPVLMVVAGAGLIFGSVQPARAEERNNTLLRRMVYGSNLALGALLLFVALVAANVVVSMRVPNKLDTTSSGFYALSDPTRDFLAGLEQPVTAYAIMPGSGSREEGDVRELLNAFQDAGRGSFKVRFISAGVNTTELSQLRVKYPQVELNEVGVLLTVGADEKRHTFVRIQDFFGQNFAGGGMQRTFEGETRLMKELVFLAENKQKPVIYFAQSNGEMDIGGGGPAGGAPPMQSANQLKNFLEKNYLEVRPLTFDLQNPKVPDDCAVLVVLEPRTPYSPAQVEAVRKYMTDAHADGRKGKLVVMAGAPLDPGRAKKVAPTGLEPVLAQFNINLGDKFLFAVSSSRQFDPYEVPTGFTVQADRAKNPIARTLGRFNLLMVFPREVSVAPGGNPAIQALPLLATDSAGGAWTDDEVPTNWDRAYSAAADSGRLVRGKTVGAVASEGTTARVAAFGNAVIVSDAVASKAGGESPVSFDLMGVTLDWLRDRPPVPTGIVAKTYNTYVMPNPKKVDEIRLSWLPLALALATVVALGAGVWVIRRK